jgi:signal transduction histidine kinase
MRRKEGGVFQAEIGISRVETVHGPIALAFVTDISSRTHAEEEIRRNQRELRALNARLTSLQEESRKQLARELHDVLTQQVGVLGAEVDEFQQRWDHFTEAMRSTFGHVQEGINELAANVHDVSRRLHPATLYELGLAAALDAECLSFSRQHGIGASVRKAAGVPRHLPDQAGLALYRIAQEAMRNAAQHARATRVRLTLRMYEGDLILAVADNGRGFDPDRVRRKGGLGLVSMEERARSVNGSLRVHSRRGGGTEVEARVPLSPVRGK